MLHLAGPQDAERLLPMIRAYHAFEGIDVSDEHRAEAIQPLLDGSPHGAIWFIGPKMAPVGYITICFGWSIELGGMEAFVDEFWIREKVRGRGMGTEALAALLPTLRDAGLRALHLEVAPGNETATRLYERLGFQHRPYRLMTWHPAS